MRILAVIMSFCFVGSFYGQQTPQYTQYRLNYFGINPALAGSKECIDVKFGYRAQWVGFDGAPRTAFATVHAPLKFKKRKSVFTGHGLGFKVESDRMGLTGTTKMYLAYAYHFPLSRDLRASFGVYGGIQQFKFNSSNSIALGGNDPAIHQQDNVIIWPDFTPGFFLQNDKFFAGLSIRNLLRNKIKNYGQDVNRFKHHYELMGGYKIEASEKISYVPSIMLKIVPLSMPSLDLNFMVNFRETLSFGLSYRNVDALAAMIKINAFKYLTFGYSFDLTTSQIRLGSSNTHEVVVGIYTCPRGRGGSYACPVFD